MISFLMGLYQGFFALLERITNGWFMGLAARLAFSSVLLMYFLNAALIKVGSYAWGIFPIPKAGAYAQMFPALAKSVRYNVDKIDVFPYQIIVFFGTYMEFILPALILLGLFTRAASLAFIVFIGVMTYVDITAHKVGPETIGIFFDRVNNSAIADQRLLWLVPLVYLMLKGAGAISLDRLLDVMFKREEI